ncbi:hypothetical protein [Geodermatophilus tzadiensis]|uniref:hypothetical protein n=1 Tax=Geodermatophilus tzadiensis TaxID=1137988 RepID=UPI001475EC33|nr:hypothetical protein [Geodermatophilus tzadiensis]
MALAEGLTDLTEDRTEATDMTGAQVPVECFPVLIRPGNLQPGAQGTVAVGTQFVVDIECRPSE